MVGFLHKKKAIMWNSSINFLSIFGFMAENSPNSIHFAYEEEISGIDKMNKKEKLMQMEFTRSGVEKETS